MAVARDTHSLSAVHKSRETHVRPKVFQKHSVDFWCGQQDL